MTKEEKYTYYDAYSIEPIEVKVGWKHVSFDFVSFFRRFVITLVSIDGPMYTMYCVCYRELVLL